MSEYLKVVEGALAGAVKEKLNAEFQRGVERGKFEHNRQLTDLLEYVARLEGAVRYAKRQFDSHAGEDIPSEIMSEVLATSPLAGQPQPAPTTGWRPIAEAPRDGTQVLVCNPFDVEGHISDAYSISCHVAAWWAEENDGRGAWIIYNNQVCEAELHYTPTHWMPLPAPPKEGE